MIRVFIDFTRPESGFTPFSWGIRLFEGTKYSHVRLRWKNSLGIELIYEASGSSVNLVGEYGAKKVETVESYYVDLDKNKYRKLIRLFRYAGVCYGFTQILGIILTYTPLFKTNPLAKGPYTQVCAELVGIFLNEVLGLNIKDLDTAGPKKINKIVKAKLKRAA